MIELTKVKSENMIVVKERGNYMPRGLQKKGIARKNKMLHTAIKLFLENGYEKTTTASIARAAGMAPSSFFAAFENKEELLLILVKTMFNNQFNSAEQLHMQADPLVLYGIETAIQMYIVELSEPLRELYVTAYSLPTTSEYIYGSMIEKLQYIFGRFIPEAKTKDFYELEIASAGVTRAYMAKKCSIYFSIEDKLRRYLQCCYTLYRVPQEMQEQAISAIMQMDLKSVAEGIIGGMIQKAEYGIDIVNDEEGGE